MRITELETVVLSYSYPPEERLAWSSGQIAGWNAAFIRIHSDTGHSGVGEVYFGNYIPEVIPPIVESLKKYLIGEDPVRLPYLWSKLGSVTKFWNRHGLGKSVLAGIDLALHDLVGTALGLPVWQLIGGLAHEKMQMYASAGCTESLERLLSEVKAAQEDGFRSYKWRVIDPGTAGEFMREIRRAVDEDFQVMVDFVQGSATHPWPDTIVMECARSMAPHRVSWIEEPYPIENKRAHGRFRDRTEIPVAAGEGVSSLEEGIAFLESEAVDFLQPDVTIAGLTLCRQLGVLAHTKNVAVASHAWGGGAALMGSLHFAFANPSSVLVEYCRLPNPLREELLQEPLSVQKGFVDPPLAPGLGIRLTDEIIGKYAYEGKTGHAFAWQGTSGT